MKTISSTSSQIHKIEPSEDLTDLNHENAGQILSEALRLTNVFCTQNRLPKLGIGILGKVKFDTIDPQSPLQIRLLSPGGGTKAIQPKLHLMKTEKMLKASDEIFLELKTIIETQQTNGVI